jgi:hypothetical protein
VSTVELRSASSSESAWYLLVYAPAVTLYHIVRSGSIGIGDTAAAGRAPPFFLTNKLAPSTVFAVNNSTEKAAAEDESSGFAGGAI